MCVWICKSAGYLASPWFEPGITSTDLVMSENEKQYFPNNWLEMSKDGFVIHIIKSVPIQIYLYKNNKICKKIECNTKTDVEGAKTIVKNMLKGMKEMDEMEECQ